MELTVGRTSGEVTHTHYLGAESLPRNGVENEALGHKLRVNVLVTQELSHVESLLGEHIVARLTSPQPSRAGCGNVNQLGALL